MAESTELHTRLMAHARSYDPTAHHRSLLKPFRDVLLLWRAKFMSYEQIAAALTQNGLKVSPAGVGVFCRREFTKVEIERTRRETRDSTLKPVPTPSPTPRSDGGGSKRGPKIARDDY